MRHFATSLIILILGALSVSAGNGVRWLGTVYDFGAFDESPELVTAHFQFVNDSNEAVAITSVRATCGCTTPVYSTDPVLPGDTATIAVSYDSEGRPGRFSKKVYVRTTASDLRTDLIIKGVVVGSESSVKGRFPVEAGKLRLRNGAVMFGRLPKGRAKMVFFDGYNRSRDTITPHVDYSPEYVEITSVPARVPPGEQMQFNAYFRSDRCPLWGVVTDSITIRSDAGQPPVTIPLVAVLEEDFSVLTPGQMQNAPVARLSTGRVDLGSISPSRSKPYTAEITLFNAGKSPLIVRRIYSEDTGIDVAVKNSTIKKEKSTVLSVSVDPADSDVINKRITLITNDPVSPTQVIRVVGTIEKSF